MKFKGLSARLVKALELALPNADFWDVGCDHGKLGISALKTKNFKRVHFVDQAKHLIEFLQSRHFEKEARFFPMAIHEVQEDVQGTMVFLGVGGTNIKNSLQKMPNLQADRLILGPHKDDMEIEELELPDYQLVEQHDVDERGRTRRLYVFDKIV